MPHCGTDFHDPGSLLEWDYTDIRYDARVSKDQDGVGTVAVDTDDTNDGDLYIPAEFVCGNCFEPVPVVPVEPVEKKVAAIIQNNTTADEETAARIAELVLKEVMS